MKGIRTGLKLAVGLVVMLAVIGIWGVDTGSLKLTGSAGAQPSLTEIGDLLRTELMELEKRVRMLAEELIAEQHFKCYVITPNAPVNEKVTVFDQFRPEGEVVTVKWPTLLCTPTKKVH